MVLGAVLGICRGALVDHSLTALHILLGAGIGAAIGGMLSGREISEALHEMPRTMKQLAVVQFFTWLGLYCMWLFFGLATTQQVIGTTDAKALAFDTGIVFAGQIFAIYSVVCFLVAFTLPPLAARIGRRTVHALALVCGAIGLLATGGIHDRTLWQCTMLSVGIAWASILSMPYAILADALPAGRAGVYMELFNFFVVAPEILLSLALGPVVKNLFGNDPVKVVMLGGGCLLLAALATRFLVSDTPVSADVTVLPAKPQFLPSRS